MRTIEQTYDGAVAVVAGPEFSELIELADARSALAHFIAPVQRTYDTREEWLIAAVRALTPIFADAGATVPRDVKVTCGWAAGKPSALGQCFPRSYSAAGVNEVFIAPSMDDAPRVLDVLVHELIHASDDCASGHKGHFAKVARKLDLEGKLTATTAGPKMRATCEYVVSLIGPYPHARLDFSQRKKQGTRMLKHECKACGAVWRMASKWQVVACPCCTAPIAGAGDAGDTDDTGDTEE